MQRLIRSWIVGAVMLASGLGVPRASAADRSIGDPPPGWAVTAAPVDPALAKLSEEELIERLIDTVPNTSDRIPEFDAFWAIGGVVNLGGGSMNLLVHSPAAVELVRRGWQASPGLLDHLTDARRTKLVYVVPASTVKRETPLGFSDEYDPRVRGGAAPADVNTKERTPLDEDDTYTFKVGDLCYATLGQIVNRNLRAVRIEGEEAMMMSGIFSPNPGDRFATVNSPVARPALAAAARKDWGGITTQQLADSLRADLTTPLPKPTFGGPPRSPPMDYGALTRLLYYYPDLGTDVVEPLLQRKLVEPIGGFNGAPREDTVGFWEQAQFVQTLAPFRSGRLQAALLDLFRRAAAAATADLRTQPAGTWDPSVPSLGSDLALQCARRLTHQGHDDELKAVFSARVEAIVASNQASVSALGRDLSGLKYVNSIQADECRKFVAELDHPASTPAARATPTGAAVRPPRSRVRLKQPSLSRRGGQLTVTIEPVDPAPERVFVAALAIDHATDDVGATLWGSLAPMLSPVAVGRTSEEEMRGPPKAAFSATLTRPSPKATAITSLEGQLVMVVPDLDPDATVTVDNISTKFGMPLDSNALRAAEVSITMHDSNTVKAGPDGGALRTSPIFGDHPVPPGFHLPTPQFEAGDVSLAISDPHERFLNVEFRDAQGQSLHYNHNGFSHSNAGNTRFDVYHLGEQIPPGTQMIVWLKTNKSFLVVPLKFSNLKIPEETPAAR